VLCEGGTVKMQSKQTCTVLHILNEHLCSRCASHVQGPSAAVAYEAAQPYSAFYKLLPVLSGTGVGRKLSQQPGPQQQQPGPQQQQAQQQGPQQPAGGEETILTFRGRQPYNAQSSPLPCDQWLSFTGW